MKSPRCDRCRNGIKNWWQGEYVPPPLSDPNSLFVVISGFYRRHWSARAVSASADFYLRHWQFVFSFAIGLAGLILAYLALK